IQHVQRVQQRGRFAIPSGRGNRRQGIIGNALQNRLYPYRDGDVVLAAGWAAARQDQMIDERHVEQCKPLKTVYLNLVAIINYSGSDAGWLRRLGDGTSHLRDRWRAISCAV